MISLPVSSIFKSIHGLQGEIKLLTVAFKAHHHKAFSLAGPLKQLLPQARKFCSLPLLNILHVPNLVSSTPTISPSFLLI